MKAYKVEAILARDGALLLEGLPFHAGERVEVIVLASVSHPMAQARSPLRGTVLQYEMPFEPVAQDDWDASS